MSNSSSTRGIQARCLRFVGNLWPQVNRGSDTERMATKIDQKEYLKRYLSNDKEKKKKKKKDKKSIGKAT